MNKKMKNYTRDAIGFGVGSVVVGKVGGLSGMSSTVRGNIVSGMGIASVAFPIRGAGIAMDSVNSLYKTRRKK